MRKEWTKSRRSQFFHFLMTAEPIFPTEAMSIHFFRSAASLLPLVHRCSRLSDTLVHYVSYFLRYSTAFHGLHYSLFSSRNAFPSYKKMWKFATWYYSFTVIPILLVSTPSLSRTLRAITPNIGKSSTCAAACAELACRFA